MSGLEDSMERARSAMARRWAEQREESERFMIQFKASWSGCGEAMAAIGRFAVSGVEWRHDPPWHMVQFDATFATLKSVQLAVKGAPVLDPKCSRVNERQRG